MDNNRTSVFCLLTRIEDNNFLDSVEVGLFSSKFKATQAAKNLIYDFACTHNINYDDMNEESDSLSLTTLERGIVCEISEKVIN